MKPVTHTASLTTSVGAPWEIKRVELEASGRIVDLYTKDGKLGAYGSYWILVPDYDVGFAALVAGFSSNADVLVGFISDVFLPALEEDARSQAAPVYTGQYQVEDEGVNSTFTLTSEDNLQGLGLINWISNETAFPGFFPVFISLAEGNFGDAEVELQAYLNGTVLVDPQDVSVRLYPTTSRHPPSDGGEKVPFRAVFGLMSPSTGTNDIADSTSAWLIADAFVYGKSGADEFIFSLDGYGSVVSVEHPFSRQIFMKV
jgi:hypothetical protein